MNTEAAAPAPLSTMTATADHKEAQSERLRAIVGQRPKMPIFREDRPLADHAAHINNSRDIERGATSSLLRKLRLELTINQAKLQAHEQMIAALTEEHRVELSARDDVAAVIGSITIHIESLEKRESGAE